LRQALAALAALVAVAAIAVYAYERSKALPSAVVSADAVPSMPPATAAGKPAPAFALRSRSGSISSDSLAGKPYLLEIFATWCPHCQRMTTVLKQIRAKFPQSRLAMLSVSGSPYAADSTEGNLIAETQADIDRFDALFGVTWPTFFDADMTVARTWGINGFPTLYVVNGRGVIVYVYSGELSERQLERAVREALS
jgi:thiol-disulfide isomerase/thioredoxin